MNGRCTCTDPCRPCPWCERRIDDAEQDRDNPERWDAA